MATRQTNWTETNFYIKKGLTAEDTSVYGNLVGSGKLVDAPNFIDDISDMDAFDETINVSSWVPAGGDFNKYSVGSTGLAEWSFTLKINDADAKHQEILGYKKRDVVEFAAHTLDGDGHVDYFTMIFKGHSKSYPVDDVTEVQFMFQVTSRLLEVEGS